MTQPNRTDNGPLIPGTPWGWVRHIFRPTATGLLAYMDRYTLRKQGPSGSNPYRVYLHRWLVPDSAGHHNHPSRWSFSLILLGSYTEEVLVPDWHYRDGDIGHMCALLPWRVVRRRVRWWNWIDSSTYHRVVALHTSRLPFLRRLGTWTLFCCGPLSGARWGYWRPGEGHVDHVERTANPGQSDHNVLQ